MKLSVVKFLPIPVLVAVLAFLWMWMTSQFKILSMAWVAFIPWGAYFLTGVNTKGAVRLGISFTLGVIFAVVIILLGTSLVPTLGGLAFPLVVAVAAFFIVLLELVPWFDMAPGYFLGAAAFFATGGKTDIANFLAVMVPAAFGLALGVLTGYLRETVFKIEHVQDPLQKKENVS